MASRILAACYLINLCGGNIFCMQDERSSFLPTSSSLKILYCREKHFCWLFCLDIAQEAGHVKEEDRRPHNPFQAEGISLFTKHISAHRYCNTGDGGNKYYSCPNCDTHATCNLFACARYSISFSALAPVFSHGTSDTCIKTHYKLGTSGYDV